MKNIMFLLFGLTLMVDVTAQNIDSLKHADYLYYVNSVAKGRQTKPEDVWLRENANNYTLESLYPTTPGSLLIKARNNIFGGFVLETAALVGLAGNNEGKKGINIACGVVGLLGLCLELNGYSKIGKAGVALNENGIGIKVKFLSSSIK